MTSISQNQIESYQLYLMLIHERMLDKYFAEQAPYLCCKNGCSHCCKKGQFPMSEIEVKFIMIKMESLDNSIQKQILFNVQELIKEKISSNKSREDFFYQCPFLINDSCSVYENRALICRTHGLMFFTEDKMGKEKYKIPYCVNLGLNYSNVYDTKLKTITDELCEKSGIKNPPQAYNLSLKTLTNKTITQELGFEFGEIKSLIEWFM